MMLSFNVIMKRSTVIGLVLLSLNTLFRGVVHASDDGVVVEGQEHLLAEEQQEVIIGHALCACSPSVYEFTLDFSLSCPPHPSNSNSTTTIAEDGEGEVRGDGESEGDNNENPIIDATACRIVKYGGQSIKDLKPVSVHSIEILELGQKLQIMKQVNVPGTNFEDGYTFKYTSMTGGNGVFRPHHSNNNMAVNPQQEQVGQLVVNPNDLPRAIQVNIAGINQEGQSIVNIMMMEFNNTCVHTAAASGSNFPQNPNLVPSIGKQQSSSLGWTKLTDLVPPINHYCPSGLRKLL